jgi:hypothetical protein
MSASNSFENGILELVFKNTDFANIGDAGGLQNSAAAGSLYFSLHTSDPGEAGDQTTNETAYTSYARVAVARSGAGFVVTASSVSPAAAVTFPACTGSTSTITHFGVGTASSGAGVLLLSGTVTPNISVSSGVTPELTTATAATCD